MAAAIIATPPARRPRRAPPPTVAVLVPALPELGAHERAVIDAGLRIIEQHWRQCGGVSFEQPHLVKEFMLLHLGSFDHEVFGAMFLNVRHQLIGFEPMFRGTLTRTAVHPREVVRRALALNAAAVVFGHNHPFGAAEPSRDDEILTVSLRQALQLVDVLVLDHIVVGCSQAISFAERGLL